MVYQSEDKISDPGATVYSNTIFLDITRGTDLDYEYDEVIEFISI